MFEYLNDMDFLAQLDKMHLRTQYAKIQLLNFNEEPLYEIQGNITAGTLTVNGASAVRRTISLTMLADGQNSALEDVENEISIKRKVKVWVGYKNPLKSYITYGDIVWFPCGVFVLSSASVSRSTTTWTISISGKDKMCMLDGTAGGTLPGSVVFHEKYVYLDDEVIEVQYPTIFQIIFEAVNHWGGEAAENIIISDLDEEVKMLVRYLGDRPIYFSNNYESLSFNYSQNFPHKISYGEDAGYKMTDFTYPGELVLKAGDTVVTLLDKIVSTLGNYEYFYDIDGHFIFQQIKNYLNTQSPLTELTEDNYIKTYDNKKFLYSLTDLDATTAININPKYDNIKNDFYAWGKKKLSSGAELDIRYHLAIEEKPEIDLAGQYMWEVSETSYGKKTIIRYDFNNTSSYSDPKYDVALIGVPCDEWREELYRRALNAQVGTSVYDNYYDSELLAEWRKLYYLNTSTNKMEWNSDVKERPNNLVYWLDFIDTSSEIGKYAVGEIGRRTKVVNDTNITSIYNKEAPDIVFIEGNDTDAIAYYSGIGQRYFQLTSQYYDLFNISTTGASCYDQIRDMLYQNLTYNTTIQITCLPKYYMEPNNIIYIEDKKSNIVGNYQITQFTLPLAYNGTMSITATEVLTRV